MLSHSDPFSYPAAYAPAVCNWRSRRLRLVCSRALPRASPAKFRATPSPAIQGHARHQSQRISRAKNDAPIHSLGPLTDVVPVSRVRLEAPRTRQPETPCYQYPCGFPAIASLRVRIASTHNVDLNANFRAPIDCRQPPVPFEAGGSPRLVNVRALVRGRNNGLLVVGSQHLRQLGGETKGTR